MPSYQTIMGAINNAYSKEEIGHALKNLGMNQLAENKSALEILFDMTHNPNSELRKKLNNDLFNQQLHFAAEQLTMQFNAIMQHNSELKQLLEAIFGQQESKKPAIHQIDEDEDKKLKGPEGPSLAQRLREQDEKIQKLADEIKETDKQIEEQQKKLTTELSSQQTEQVKRVENIHDNFIKQLVDQEVSAIAADDPKRAEKIQDINNRFSKDNITHNPNDKEIDKLLKDYNNIVQSYNTLLQDTKDQIPKLSSPEAIKMSNGHSLEQLALKFTLMDQYASAQFSALEKRAQETLDIYKNYENKIERLNNSLTPEKLALYEQYNQYEKDIEKLDSKIEKLNKDIYLLDKEIDTYNLAHPNEEPTEELVKKVQAKVAMEQERNLSIQEREQKGQKMVELHSTWKELLDAKKEANRLQNFFGTTDPQEIIRMTKNAEKMLESIQEQRSGLKSIKEYGQKLDERMNSISTNPIVKIITDTLSKLFNFKSEKVRALEQEVEKKADVVLNISNMKEVEMRQVSEQKDKPAPVVSNVDEEENRQQRPGMSPKPSTGASTS